MSSTTAIRPETPETINSLADAVFPAMAMLAGMKLDVFSPLINGPLTTDDLAAEIRVPPRQLGPLLYALVEAGLLVVENGRFSNTGEAARFLVKGAPGYVGAIHLTWSRRWAGLVKLADSIKSDSPQARIDFSTMSPEELEDSYSGSYAAARAAGNGLVERYDFSAYRRLVDVAGGSGGVAIGITESCPNIQATVVDLPSTIHQTRKFLDAAGASDRVDVHAANVVEGPFPGSYDVAVLKAFIQVLSADHARKVLRHVNQSLEPGGALFVLGTILGDSRLTPSFAVKSNLNFLNVYDEGRAYTEGEYRAWLEEAGFVFLERVVVPDGTSIIKAQKPLAGAVHSG
ncbi:MAG: methyltransferase [Chloroflexi bacterium]|nr:methyltransferase [Chloroflexota bacterium]